MEKGEGKNCLFSIVHRRSEKKRGKGGMPFIWGGKDEKTLPYSECSLK